VTLCIAGTLCSCTRPFMFLSRQIGADKLAPATSVTLTSRSLCLSRFLSGKHTECECVNTKILKSMRTLVGHWTKLRLGWQFRALFSCSRFGNGCQNPYAGARARHPHRREGSAFPRRRAGEVFPARGDGGRAAADPPCRRPAPPRSDYSRGPKRTQHMLRHERNAHGRERLIRCLAHRKSGCCIQLQPIKRAGRRPRKRSDGKVVKPSRAHTLTYQSVG
jgi:hypothetical protein